jgi:hypothetical protein
VDHVSEAIDPRQVALWGQHTVKPRHRLADLEMFADESMYGELESELPFTTFKRKLNLLVSSPNARVFYHFDVPGQTLVQLRGRKRIWISPPAAPFRRPESVENTVRSVATEVRIDPDAPNGVRPIERTATAAQGRG